MYLLVPVDALIDLLQKSGIPEGKGYGGFPVSGIWLRCDEDKISSAIMPKFMEKQM